jgi:SAM-dependent methyltransferase
LTQDLTAVGANPYSDTDLADYYSGLDYIGTFQLAVRDLPDIIARQVEGSTALDFACGGGRSTRFLKALGFDTIGADISQRMLANAMRRDPEGVYLLVGDGDLSSLAGSSFNLILSAFPFSATTTQDKVRAILSELRNLLAPEGRLVVIEATDALYRHEWLSFSTSAYPENAAAKSGDPVPIVFRDRMDQPVFDILWTDEDYRRSFEAVGLRPLEVHRPLARDDDPDPWVSEREIPPWVIYVLSASRGK